MSYFLYLSIFLSVLDLVYNCMIWNSRINLILFSVSIYLSIYPRTGLHLHDLDQQDESHLIFCIYLSIYPRTGLQLHDLDQQDESRLIFCIYGLVRCGLLEDAQVTIIH